MFVTLKQLKDVNACEDQVKLFKEVFGEQTEITRITLTLAKDVELNIKWYVDTFLCEKLRNDYNKVKIPLFKSYEESKLTLLKVYKDFRAILLKQYGDSRTLLQIEYEITKSPLLVYNEFTIPLWKEYSISIAKLKETYEKSRIKIWVEYTKSIHPLFKKYQESIIDSLCSILELS